MPLDDTAARKGYERLERYDWKLSRTVLRRGGASNRLSLFGHRFLARKLGLTMALPVPQDFIPRFCNKLGLSGDVQTKTLEILKEATSQELTSGRGPVGIAAASLYIASVLCGERRTQCEIADVAGVTEVTIRNRYKEMVEKMDIEIVL